MKLLPIAVKSGALAKLLNNHIIIDQVMSSKTTTDAFPDKQVTIRQLRWQHDSKSVRLTYRTSQQVKCPYAGNYDSITTCHTDISYRDNKWRMTPALSTGALDFETYANYVGTAQYLSEVIRGIAENITPPTFQQWKERFINA
jgi:hypothetical protein